MANRLIMVIGLQAGKDCQNFLVHLQTTQASGLPLGNYRNIHNLIETIIVVSKQLTKPAFETIATNGITNLTAYRNTETRDFTSRTHDDSEMICLIAPSLLPDLLVLTGTAHPANFLEGLFSLHP